MLAGDEVAAYRRDGFVVPRWRLPPDLLGRLQAATERLLADNPEHTAAPMVAPHVPGSGAQRLKAGPAWREVALLPAVLDLVESLVGPDIVLWGSTVFYKPPLAGRATPWHRDGHYWPITPLATTSAWIAVWDSLVENGCLRCIPGSQQARVTGEHFTADRDDLMIQETLAPGQFDERQAVDVELAAGQLVLFDVYTIHGSNHNPGRRPRAGYASRFMPATSHYAHDQALRRDQPGNAHHLRPLILARGVDRSGRNDFRRGHPESAATTRQS